MAAAIAGRVAHASTAPPPDPPDAGAVEDGTVAGALLVEPANDAPALARVVETTVGEGVAVWDDEPQPTRHSIMSVSIPIPGASRRVSFNVRVLSGMVIGGGPSWRLDQVVSTRPHATDRRSQIDRRLTSL